jgi:phenylacetate-CoA ligase
MTRPDPAAWAQTFDYARRRSSYYRELLRGYSKAPPLHTVPLVDKSRVSERNLDFLCVPRKRVIEIVTTSGTLARPLLWMLTERDVQRLALNEKRSFECVGLGPGDTVLVAVALDRCFIAGLAYWLGLRELGCSVVRVGPTSPRLVLEMIERVQPNAIVAVPSFLRLIAQKAAETRVALRRSSVRKLICIGEPVREPGLALNSAGRAIEQAFAARVYSTYGVTELANSMCECQAAAGGHVHEEFLHVEAVDESGVPVDDGQVGEIVATTFGVEAMPLIRYRTGDCAALFHGRCRCGRTTPRVGPIVGRKNQKLKFKGASLFPSTLQAVLEQAEGVESFVILARAQSPLSDSVEVLVHGSASLSSVREALQARSKIVPEVRRASRARIEGLQLAPESRKRTTFVDLR